jgi:hypothetical protein
MTSEDLETFEDLVISKARWSSESLTIVRSFLHSVRYRQEIPDSSVIRPDGRPDNDSCGDTNDDIDKSRPGKSKMGETLIEIEI